MVVRCRSRGRGPEVGALSFEEALAELEQIVRGLEGGQQKLEEAITAYERGAALRRHCEAKLAEAEARVAAIVERADGTLGTRADGMRGRRVWGDRQWRLVAVLSPGRERFFDPTRSRGRMAGINRFRNGRFGAKRARNLPVSTRLGRLGGLSTQIRSSAIHPVAPRLFRKGSSSGMPGFLTESGTTAFERRKLSHSFVMPRAGFARPKPAPLRRRR